MDHTYPYYVFRCRSWYWSPYASRINLLPHSILFLSQYISEIDVCFLSDFQLCSFLCWDVLNCSNMMTLYFREIYSVIAMYVSSNILYLGLFSHSISIWLISLLVKACRDTCHHDPWFFGHEKKCSISIKMWYPVNNYRLSSKDNVNIDNLQDGM